MQCLMLLFLTNLSYSLRQKYTTLKKIQHDALLFVVIRYEIENSGVKKYANNMI